MNRRRQPQIVVGQRGSTIMKNFVRAYTRGYSDGLYLMGLSSFLSTDGERHRMANSVLTGQDNRSAYQEGFREGLKDSATILRILQAPLDQLLL